MLVEELGLIYLHILAMLLRGLVVDLQLIESLQACVLYLGR